MRRLVAQILTAACLIAAAPVLEARAAIEGSSTWEGGNQLSDRLSDGEVTRSRFYLLGKAEAYLDELRFDGSARLTADLRENKQELSVRELAVGSGTEHFRWKLGFQEISWGETFGFNVADLVNPRDYSDPLLTDQGWVRLPVAALNTQLLLDRLSLQLVATPIPRPNLYPSKTPGAVALPVAEAPSFRADRLGADAEFGGRAGYLFENGLDLGVIAYRHWNRDAAVAIAPTASGPVATPIRERVTSTGLTASQAFDSLVLRGDSIVHLGSRTQWQTILGSDLTLADDWLLGAQLHQDREEDRTLRWASFKVQKRLSRLPLELECFVFRGLGNQDSWIQPAVLWNVSPRIALSLRGDLVSAGEEGRLVAMKEESRVLSWLTVRL